MYTLKNITKKYLAKNGAQIVALNGISLDLPDKGMVFLCGRSGSGKSTLLNILGGMDKASSGEIKYLGSPIEKAPNVGFVFQEYYLIANMTVGENVALPLALLGIKDKQQRVSNVLASVGLNNYQNRRINELSGGQKQRVAIARALVKEPQVILADEPTGNLDSKTATEIFDLLKSLSKDRLVVVVTHDIDSAKKYHDYLVELEDGKIVFNNCPTEQQSPPQLEEKQCNQRKGKNFLVYFRQALCSLADCPIKPFSVILSAVLAIICLTALQMFIALGSFSTRLAIIEDINPLLFNARYESDERHNFSLAVLDELDRLQQNLNYLKCENEFIVSGSQDILDFGLKFIDNSFIELDENTLYITDLALATLIKNGQYPKNEIGEQVEISQNTPISQIIGLSHPSYADSIIGGIVDTSAFRHGVTNLDSPFTRFFDMPFLLSSFKGRLSIQSFFSTTKNNIFLGNADHSYTQQLEINNKSKSGYILDISGQLLEQNELLQYGQIAVSLSIYNKLFNEQNSIYDFVKLDNGAPSGVSFKKTPAHLGEMVKLELNEVGHHKKLSYDLTIIGIIIDTSSFVNDELIVVSDQAAREINDVFVYSDLLIDANSITNMHSFLMDADSLALDLYYPYHDITNKALEQSTVWVFVFSGLGIIFVALATMVIINMIGMEIMHKRKQFGILRAIGASGWDLFAPLIIEAGVMSVIICSVNTALSFFIANALEYIFAEEFVISGYSKYFRLFSVNWLTILIIFLLAVLATLTATIIPIIKIKRLNTIDAIKR